MDECKKWKRHTFPDRPLALSINNYPLAWFLFIYQPNFTEEKINRRYNRL